MANHLIYHVCPLVHNDGWLRNLEQLGRRIDLFDGQRIVAVAQGEGCHEYAYTVGMALYEHLDKRRDHPVRVLLQPNCPVTREVASFVPLLEVAEEFARPGDAIFYAHSKGNSTADGELGATRWRNAMYEHLLRPEAPEMLRDFKMVGACAMTWDPANRRRRGSAWRCPFPATPGKQRPIEPRHRWLFAGTFFWFTPHVFDLDWRGAVDGTDRYGAECWPGNLYRRDQVASVYQPRPDHEPWNPYDPRHYGAQHDD